MMKISQLLDTGSGSSSPAPVRKYVASAGDEGAPLSPPALKSPTNPATAPPSFTLPSSSCSSSHVVAHPSSSSQYSSQVASQNQSQHNRQYSHMMHHRVHAYHVVLVPAATCSCGHPTCGHIHTPSSYAQYPRNIRTTGPPPISGASSFLLPSPAGSENSDICNSLDTLADLALVGPATQQGRRPSVGGFPQFVAGLTIPPPHNSNGGSLMAPRHILMRNRQHRQQTSVHPFHTQNYQPHYREDTVYLPNNEDGYEDKDSVMRHGTKRKTSDSSVNTGSSGPGYEPYYPIDESLPASNYPPPSAAQTSHHATALSQQPNNISSRRNSLAALSAADPERRYICPHYGQPKAKRWKYSDLSRMSMDPDDLICHARFRRRQEMERHIMSVHGSEEDKAWVCPGPPGGVGPCGRRYARADALRKHLVSSRSRSVVDGCSYGLREDEIVSMTQRFTPTLAALPMSFNTSDGLYACFGLAVWYAPRTPNDDGVLLKRTNGRRAQDPLARPTPLPDPSQHICTNRTSLSRMHAVSMPDSDGGSSGASVAVRRSSVSERTGASGGSGIASFAIELDDSDASVFFEPAQCISGTEEFD
ncbi:hypothetical protein BC830DRAFT_1226071 [Chytriomyces sp. MP71]|nr:hypothetical protein BC830DRAFT_1226071 [Chytriomyces sp. MP71]